MTPAYLTTEIDGNGGVIKRRDEDFLVHEIPLYGASGAGTHTYFLVEKRGLPTLAAIRILAKALGKSARDIGYAGLKDAHGVTRQWFSIEHVLPERVWALNEADNVSGKAGADGERSAAPAPGCGKVSSGLGRIRILEVQRHTNKIKLGHLAGNRFEIKIRFESEQGVSTDPNATATAGAVFDVLQRRGVPNYFGPQRFGVRGDNAAVGLAVLRQDYAEAMSLMLGRPDAADNSAVNRARALYGAGKLLEAADAWPQKFAAHARLCRVLHKSGDAKRAWRSVDLSLRRLYLSAVQSALFNAVLVERITTMDQLMAGDVAWKHANGACFLVEDAVAERPRCDAFEISPSGPLFGRKMKSANGEPAAIEDRILQNAGVLREELTSFEGFRLDGARRPLRVPLTDSSLEAGIDEAGEFLLLRFALPPGAYATNVTREICKSDR